MVPLGCRLIVLQVLHQRTTNSIGLLLSLGSRQGLWGFGRRGSSTPRAAVIKRNVVILPCSWSLPSPLRPLADKALFDLVPKRTSLPGAARKQVSTAEAEVIHSAGLLILSQAREASVC